MTKDRKTVYVNDHPVWVFLWAEVQHCVNAYDNDLYLAVQRGEAEIQDERGDRIGWGGFAGDGQHIYVRPIIKGKQIHRPDQNSLQARFSIKGRKKTSWRIYQIRQHFCHTVAARRLANQP